MEERKNLALVGIIICGLAIMILLGCLYFVMSGLIAYSQVMHENKMEELELQKEIALLPKQEFKGNINYNNSSFPCVIEMYQWTGNDYEINYEFVSTCYEVVK